MLLPLPLQRSLQEGGTVELVRGGRVGHVDDVDGEAGRDAVRSASFTRTTGGTVAGVTPVWWTRGCSVTTG